MHRIVLLQALARKEARVAWNAASGALGREKALRSGTSWLEGTEGQQRRGMKVYTRTGDKGSSQLFNGERRDKDDLVFHALGAVDECNAFIGLAREFSIGTPELSVLSSRLEYIMSRMFDVGANVATPQDTSSKAKLGRSHFDACHTKLLEDWIDEMDTVLPPLRTFILPSGGQCSAHLHVARTISRRAERSVVPLIKDGQTVPEVGVFLNRLSDFLFVSARFAAAKQGVDERTWQKWTPAVPAEKDLPASEPKAPGSQDS